MALENMTWGSLRDQASLLDCIYPDHAHEYLSRVVFMDFDAKKEKPNSIASDDFRDKTLLPAIFAIASLHIPELRPDVEARNAVVTELWKAIMVKIVIGDDLPASDDPDRNRKTIEKMDEVLKETIKEMLACAPEDPAPESPAPGF